MTSRMLAVNWFKAVLSYLLRPWLRPSSWAWSLAEACSDWVPPYWLFEAEREGGPAPKPAVRFA